MRFLLNIKFDFESYDYPAARDTAQVILRALDYEVMKLMPEYSEVKFQRCREYGPPEGVRLFDKED